MTEYIVLGMTDDAVWDEIRHIDARSAHSAIRAVVEQAKPSAARFVAVPARSWKPVTVKVETKTALKFS